MVNQVNTCSKFDFDAKRTRARRAVHSNKNHHSNIGLYTLNATRMLVHEGARWSETTGATAMSKRNKSEGDLPLVALSLMSCPKREMKNLKQGG